MENLATNYCNLLLPSDILDPVGREALLPYCSGVLLRMSILSLLEWFGDG